MKKPVSKMALRLVVFALASLFAGSAFAAPKVSTKYKSYSVPGKSAQQLFQHMSRYGPHANGSPALATTAANFTHSAKLNRKGKCRLQNYQVNMAFVITLPKARNRRSMSKSLRKRWDQFATHAKWHELQHRKIWVQCARRIEAKVRKMGGQKSCERAWARARQIANVQLKSCDAKHARFDDRESTRAAKLPLIAQALRPQRQRKSSKVANRQVVHKSTTKRKMGKMYD